MKETFQPHRKKRAKKIGFLKRMRSKSGRSVINRRRRQKRKRLAG